MKNRPKTSRVGDVVIWTRCFTYSWNPREPWKTAYARFNGTDFDIERQVSHANRRDAMESHYFNRGLVDALENTPTGSYPAKLATRFIHRSRR